MSANPIFVVGTPRSGTTLIAVLLGRHSQIAMTPETGFYDEIAPQLKETNDLSLERILKGWSRLPELGLIAEEVVKACAGDHSIQNVLSVLLELYARIHGKTIAGEKTPQHLLHARRILNDFPTSRMICIQRDGRDVALSLAAMPWWAKSLGLEGAAARWRSDLALAAMLAAEYPQRFACFRLEDVVSKPESILNDIMSFIGLEFQPRQMQEGPSPVVLDRSLEWKGGALRAPDATLVGKRRELCSASDLAYLNCELEDSLRQTGYDIGQDRLKATTSLRSRKWKSKPRVSICVLTKNSAVRLTPLLAHLSLIADQVVVGVDEDSADRTLEVAAAGADTIFRFEKHNGQLAAARMLFFDYADGDWILCVDDDERLECNFANIVEPHLGNEMITHCWFPRKVVSKLDEKLFYKFPPWYPDWQLRLFRNERTLVWKPSRPHSGFNVQGAGIKEAKTSILHFNQRIRSAEEYEDIYWAYRAAGASEEACANHWASTDGPMSPVPLWFDPPVLKRPSLKMPLYVHKLSSLYQPPLRAVFESVDMPSVAVAGSLLTVELTARNVGEITWMPNWSHRSLPIRLSYHLKNQDGAMIKWDNERFDVPKIVAPLDSAKFIIEFDAPAEHGAYSYDWDFVLEEEAWFEALGSHVATKSLLVTPASGEKTTVIQPLASPTSNIVSDKHEHEEVPVNKSNFTAQAGQ